MYGRLNILVAREEKILTQSHFVIEGLVRLKKCLGTAIGQSVGI